MLAKLPSANKILLQFVAFSVIETSARKDLIYKVQKQSFAYYDSLIVLVLDYDLTFRRGLCCLVCIYAE